MKRILVIVNRQSMRDFIVGVLQDEFEIAVFGNRMEALQESAKKKYDLVIVDSELSGMDALETLYNFRKSHSAMPRIFLSSKDGDADARKSGASKVLLKPFTPEALATAVKNLLV